MKQRLWYERPASQWLEALPVGNGRLGAMIFGGISKERIQLNEDSIWYGRKDQRRENQECRTYLEMIRHLLQEGELEKATFLSRMAMYSSPQYFGPYQPLGDLNLLFYGHDGKAEDYRRELDLERGMVTVSYRIGETRYYRSLFSSFPDQCIVVHLWCEGPESMTLCANLTRRPFDEGTETLKDDLLLMKNQCQEGGVQFAAALHGVCKNGTLRTIGRYLLAEETRDVTFFLTSSTSYRTETFAEQVVSDARKAGKRTYKELEQRHVEDYRQLFSRVDFQIGGKLEEAEKLPTDHRLKRVKEGNEDIGIQELMLQYARYLLISSSRGDSLPANLQGIWNQEFTPAWESNYTININTEMNYWIAEPANVSECHEPLFRFIELLAKRGRETAKQMYGCRGFVAHHATNLWGDTAIQGAWDPGVIWPMGGAWLSLHLWEHYEYSQDEEFLRNRVYPVLREACLFFLDFLQKDADGRWMNAPSVSPENSYVSAKGICGSLSTGTAMDIQIIRMMFEKFIKTLDILQLEDAERQNTEAVLCELPLPQIGSNGCLVEWEKEYQEVEPGHRHMSHLFALHPGDGISVYRDKRLAEAAKNTILRRLEYGGGHTGWSCAWIINMWARLGEGERAYQFLLHLLEKSIYPNLFDAHPPFQIDGNFGCASGIIEMLMQSHQGFIELLPALPKAWKSGSISGLRARGNFAVDICWENGTIRQFCIRSESGRDCKVLLHGIDGQNILEENSQTRLKVENGMILFQTQKGKSYKFTCLKGKENK